MEATEVRRARALCRDHRRLGSVLAAHDQNRFDLETVQAVRDRTTDLLETLAFITADDTLWEGLQATAATLTEEASDALSNFDDVGFGAVLTAAGYVSPPPPPVTVLLADTRDALAGGLGISAGPNLIHEARISLVGFVYRTRRHVAYSAETEPSQLAGLGDASARVARELIPTVVATGAGAIVGGIVGVPSIGAGVGITVAEVARKTLEKTVETGAEIAARSALDFGRRQRRGFRLPTVTELPSATPDQVIAGHLATVTNILTAAAGRYTLDECGPAFALAEKHLTRVRELAIDHNSPVALGSAVDLSINLLAELRLRLVDPFLEWQRRSVWSRADLLDLARECADVAVESLVSTQKLFAGSVALAPFNSTVDWWDEASPTTARLQKLWELWNSANPSDLSLRAGLAKAEHLPTTASAASSVGATTETTPAAGSVIGATPATTDEASRQERRFMPPMSF